LQDRVYTYTEDVVGEDDVPIFSCYVSEVFRGTDTNIVQVRHVFLIDNDILQISAGEYYGNMQVTSVTSTQVTLGNWKNLYLSQSPSTCQIRGNLSFKTVYNTGAIEFYPHLIRNELPVLSGGGGFASNHCGGYSWDMYENYTLGWNQVDLVGTKAWIVLCKDGVVVDEKILTEEWGAPVDSDCQYSYVRDGTEIITATLKAAFRGCNANMIELGEIHQRSEIDGSMLINNESHLLPTATEPSGTPWNLSDSYILTVPDVGLDGDEIRLQLSKDDVIVKEKILNEDYANTFTYASGIGGVNCVVDRVFCGCEANAVKLVDVNQYSEVSGTALIVDGSYFYKSGDPVGISWALSDGYVLTMKDVDRDGDKVWLELSKDDTVLKEDILESGDLFEYRNALESVDCVVEAVFRGTLVNVVKLKNVNQYSSTGAQLMNDESKTYTTAELVVGEMWELCEGYSLAAIDIDMDGDKVWLSLFKDGVSVRDAIVDANDDRWFEYYSTTGALIFRAYVDAVFRGTDTNIIQLKCVAQYSDIDGSVLIMFEEDDKKTLSTGGSIPHIPETLTVDDSGGADYTSIQAAIDASESGDTIIVHNGTYHENVRVNKQLELIGIDMPLVDGGWNNSAIEVTADHCTVNGFRFIHGSSYGIRLCYSSNSTLRNNAMSDNTYNLDVSGRSLAEYTHDINTSNTVDGKPVYYLVNAESQVIDSTSNAGYVAAINSSNITVRDLTLRNSSYGVLFYHTNDSRIENVCIYNIGYGIMLGDSHGNYVMDNTVNRTGGFAVFMESSGRNTLENNIVESEYLGILAIGDKKEDYNNSIDTSNILNKKPIHYYYNLHDATIQGLDTTHLTVACSDNVTIKNNNIGGGDIMFLPFLNDSTITGNTVQDNYFGTYMYTRSSNNTLYHNNFINNTGEGNAYDEGIHNQWDSGTEGNYWNDYVGNDTDHDGIGDEPYHIHGSAGSVDRYPLMQPWAGDTQQLGDLNGDDRITPTDATIVLAIAAGGGSASYDPATFAATDVNGDGRVTSLDALMILKAAAGAIKL
jgi:parallel beta-helix repeat protein